MVTAFVAIGGNLIPEGFETLDEVMAEAMKALSEEGLVIAKCSSWYGTAPVPVSDQPWFLNAVMAIETDLSETALLQLLHEVETKRSFCDATAFVQMKQNVMVSSATGRAHNTALGWLKKDINEYSAKVCGCPCAASGFENSN